MGKLQTAPDSSRELQKAPESSRELQRPPDSSRGTAHQIPIPMRMRMQILPKTNVDQWLQRMLPFTSADRRVKSNKCKTQRSAAGSVHTASPNQEFPTKQTTTK